MNLNQLITVKKLFDAYEARFSDIEKRYSFPLKINEYADKYVICDDNNKFVFEIKRLSNGYKFFYDDSGYYSKNVIVCLIIAMARCFDYKVNIQDNLNEIFDVHPVLRTVTEGEL